MLEFKLRSRADWKADIKTEQWVPVETAVIICDMWDAHWCKGATARVAELAPRINQLVTSLRDKGVLVIHSPSATLKTYTEYPGRKMTLEAPQIDIEAKKIDLPPHPIDSNDGGCDCVTPCTVHNPWTKQIDCIDIKDEDGIGDDDEVLNLLTQRGIKNVLIMGVHENMCIIGRPFGIVRLVGVGFKVALVRDLTDVMYNHRSAPYVDHFTGGDMFTEYIERNLCPTITSDQVLGGKPFQFNEDKRPRD